MASVKYHMKRDLSGYSACRAKSEASCPNKEFGHFDTPEELMESFGNEMERRYGNTLNNNSTLRPRRNQHETTRANVTNLLNSITNKNDEATYIAMQLINDNDQVYYNNNLNSSDISTQKICAERINNAEKINEFITKSNHGELLYGYLAQNRNITREQKENIAKRLGEIGEHDLKYMLTKQIQIDDLNKQEKSTTTKSPEKVSAIIKENKTTLNFENNFNTARKELIKQYKNTLATTKSGLEKYETLDKINKLQNVDQALLRRYEGTSIISGVTINFEYGDKSLVKDIKDEMEKLDKNITIESDIVGESIHFQSLENHEIKNFLETDKEAIKYFTPPQINRTSQLFMDKIFE